MILVNADKINKSYTETPLLQDISLSIHEGEKIGLIGVNGTGKSTLLKIVAGIEEPDSGRVVYTNDVKRAFLPQHPEYDGDLTVAEQAAEYMAEVDPKTPDFACRSMMTKLGVRDFDAKMKELSGGQRKRVAMAAVLSAGADFLILDEPTNHMDNDVIAYLEDFLVKYKGAVLMITHDRYFLDRVTKKIFEIDGGVSTLTTETTTITWRQKPQERKCCWPAREREPLCTKKNWPGSAEAPEPAPPRRNLISNASKNCGTAS